MFSPSATEIYIGVVWLSISAILKFSNIDIAKCSWPPKTTISSLTSLGWCQLVFACRLKEKERKKRSSPALN